MSPPRWPWKITPIEKLSLTLIILAFLLFGFIIEMRLDKPYSPSDFPVYSRAAWAVRARGDLYTAEDEHHWHYVYPPLMAILLVPLAEPPSHRHLGPSTNPTDLAPAKGHAHHHEELPPPGFYLPRRVSVGIWFILSTLAMTLGILSLAHALEDHVPGLRPDPNSPSDRALAWALRGLPVLISLGAILTNLGRGQMEELTLGFFCFAIASLIRGKSFRAGLLLAFPICIKLVPVLLLLYPLLRFNLRCLLGAAVGLLLGLLVIPLAALGPQRTLTAYQEFKKVMIDPSTENGADVTRQKELIQMSQGDTQSLMSVFQNTRYFNVPRDDRPARPDADLRDIAGLISLTMLAITFAVTGVRQRDPALATALTIGCLLVVMLVITPVSHSHYWGLMAPLSMSIIAWLALIQKRRRAGDPLFPADARLPIAAIAALSLCCCFDLIDRLPRIDKPMRDLGFATYSTLFAWAIAVLILHRLRRAGSVAL